MTRMPGWHQVRVEPKKRSSLEEMTLRKRWFVGVRKHTGGGMKSVVLDLGPASAGLTCLLLPDDDLAVVRA